MQLEGKTVLLTGGLGGLGQGLTVLLKEAGARVIILDRSPGEDVWQTDLSDFDALDVVCQKLRQEPIDVLINLAGLMYFGHMEDQDPHHLSAMIRVNIEVPFRLTQAVLPGMLERRKGQIVNIGSVLGSLPFPHFVSYSTTKAGVKAFSDSLRREIAGKGVVVTHIAPRAVKTPLNSGLIPELHKRTKTVNDPPEKVVRVIFDAIVHDKKNVTIGGAESFFVKLHALLPSLVDQGLVDKRDIAEELLKPTRSQTP